MKNLFSRHVIVRTLSRYNFRHWNTHSLSMTRHSTPFSSAMIFADLTSSLAMELHHTWKHTKLRTMSLVWCRYLLSGQKQSCSNKLYRDLRLVKFLPYKCFLSKVVPLLQCVYNLRQLVGLCGLRHLHLSNTVSLIVFDFLSLPSQVPHLACAGDLCFLSLNMFWALYKGEKFGSLIN